MTSARSHVLSAVALMVGALASSSSVSAHHSFAMYDLQKTHVFTGVVTRVTPDASHLQIFFVPLNEKRDQVVRDAAGQPAAWVVELRGAGTVTREGVTVEAFPPGTIFSIGLHPLRTGRPAGGRGDSGLFKCPAKTPPAPGTHCDAVNGSTAHGKGVLPVQTHNWTP